jgi:hypothetical protein
MGDGDHVKAGGRLVRGTARRVMFAGSAMTACSLRSFLHVSSWRNLITTSKTVGRHESIGIGIMLNLLRSKDDNLSKIRLVQVLVSSTRMTDSAAWLKMRRASNQAGWCAFSHGRLPIASPLTGQHHE